jgi:hypothetical protein
MRPSAWLLASTFPLLVLTSACEVAPSASGQEDEARVEPQMPLADAVGGPTSQRSGHTSPRLAVGSNSGQPPAPSVDPPVEDDSEPTLFRQLDETFKRKGEVKDGVYRLVTPRSDLLVTMDGRDVATGAFLESDFRFWRCPCGKLLVNGQFVLADHEVNDVVDELQEGRLHVVAIAPLLLHEKPRLLMVRFQGEGSATELATALRSALSYTGDERSQPLPADLSPREE